MKKENQESYPEVGVIQAEIEQLTKQCQINNSKIHEAQIRKHQLILNILEVRNESYLENYAEEILQDATKEEVDPKWLFYTLSSAARIAIHGGSSLRWRTDQPTAHEKLADEAMQAVASGRQYINISYNRAYPKLEEAERIARTEEVEQLIDSSQRMSAAYQWMRENLIIFCKLQERHFWDNY